MNNEKHTFVSAEDFGALNMAQQWCRDNGISYGSTDTSGRVALMRGEFYISKWRNLTLCERRDCDGVMRGNFRTGPVVIEMKPQ